jgi:CRP-like cAMP-binding protein
MDRQTQSRQNRLLQLISAEDFDRLQPHLQHVDFAYKLPLCKANTPIEFVYFPITGVASLVNTMADGSAAEVGTIGNEGMVGLPVILGDRVAPTSIFIQVPGAGLRLRADFMIDAIERGSSLRKVMLHYVNAFFNQVAQSAACNHFHTIEQRCCRWLLMTHDRVQSDQFILTQEFLGMMLGAQRTSVTLVAGELKRRKLIQYSRGRVKILNRPGLEKCSCECYAVSKREFDRLLGPPEGLE